MRTHSVVGLITNSSSETFTMKPEKIDEIMYDHLDAVLGAAGSDVSARELFEIVIESDGGDLERKAWEFQDTELMTDELEDAIKKHTNQNYITDNVDRWPDEARAVFDAWLAEQGGAGVSASRSYSGEDETRYYGAVFVRNRETGQIDTKLSAKAWGILDIFNNGEGEY